MNRNNAMNIHLAPEQIQFSVFTTEEIKKMCVTKIITPLMLDPLGHPIPGGLYDMKLGPLSDKSDICETCCKTMTNCPGHFGYIELPLPVINPVFHKIIGTILKICCLNCYMIQIPTHVKRILIIQIKLLNCGQIIPVMEVESKMLELIGKYTSYENIPEESITEILGYEVLADKMSKDLNEDVSTQNTEALRNHLVSQMLREIKTKHVCMYCKMPINQIQTLKNRIILISRKGDKKGTVTGMESKYINPEQSRFYLRNIWKKENDFLRYFVSVLGDIEIQHPTDVFFFEVIPVPPSNIRPVNFVKGRVVENKQSLAYKNILQNVILLRAIIIVAQKKGETDSLSSAQAKAAYSAARGNTVMEKLNFAWEELQNDVNALLDKESDLSREGEGLKQMLEKKEGIVRMCMMGKRVNFSARSVITPDPNLNIDEIGIPEEFAKRLTYPVPVTPWNVDELRKMILNGPNIHPGAVMVETNGFIRRINPKNKTQQESILKSLLTPEDKARGGQSIKIVHRHLCNGDILLLNRQPSLHKPSIMAHTARILHGEKTLRLHYANCKAYNADFDGDEMNAHFPQNEVARSEGYNVANVSNQYLVPKDGTPLSGLIQDHMIAGVKLSIRGRFFSREDYHQLVYQALSFKTDKIKLLPPAIVKPCYLWSGKQILSTVIINIIPKGKELINLTTVSKIPVRAWQTSIPRYWKAGGTPFYDPNNMSEAEVIIRNGELLVGILDKQHYGATPYGLIHCIYELYGGIHSTRLLSSLGKLFMSFLQREGFTLGVEDILVVRKADSKRKKIINKIKQIGNEAITTALDLPEDTPPDEIVEKIEEISAINPKIRAIIDREYKIFLDGFTNDINKTCLPAGLVCKFPQNNLQLMVQSGAKGSTVNTMQISCLLGQIELEGKRPPVMISGKTLPSFPAFEFSPRAGGFIDGRFMTGIQPQEFFFHCMAGREGLIDTAVKTSRSGYLQRCLIKHLEGLKIEYDMTVRNSDKSVIQYRYGEDGMDVSKSPFINKKQLQFLSENVKVLMQPENLEKLKNDEDQELIKEHAKKVTEWKLHHGSALGKKRKGPFLNFSKYVSTKFGYNKVKKSKMLELWRELDPKMKDDRIKKCEPCPDPVDSLFQPDAHFGALNERIEELLEDFQPFKRKKAKKEFRDVMKLKVMQSMCPPGEPVGLLAAQSIGEPSTQMTLNTFHFAGRGEMNVTLGIPRLREILMTASKVIKTPSMEIPFLPCPDVREKAALIRRQLTKVVVADVLENIEVEIKLETLPRRQHKYVLKFNFLPKKYYRRDYCVVPRQILAHMKKKFFSEFFAAIRKICKVKYNLVSSEEKKTQKSQNQYNDDDDDDKEEKSKQQAGDDDVSSSEDEGDDEDAKVTKKMEDTKEDQEPEEEEKEMSDDEDDKPEEKSKENEETEDGVQDKTVIDSYNHAQNYIEDGKKHQWCQLTFCLPLNFKKLDLSTILKDVANKSILWETPNIKRAIVYSKDDKLMLKTEGINIIEMFKYSTVLDLQQLYCNDIHKIAETYGIEAAARVLVREVKDVFNVYGIKVDPRHLSLIADYMTFGGTYEPMSRKGMESSCSPLQQISFESSLTFLRNATLQGKHDNLHNPSSCLMTGKPCETGTGSFTLLHDSRNV